MIEIISTPPDRLYLQMNDDDGNEYPEHERTHCEDKIHETDVEYIRVQSMRRDVTDGNVSPDKLNDPALTDRILDEQFAVVDMDNPGSISARRISRSLK